MKTKKERALAHARQKYKNKYFKYSIMDSHLKAFWMYIYVEDVIECIGTPYLKTTTVQTHPDGEIYFNIHAIWGTFIAKKPITKAAYMKAFNAAAKHVLPPETLWIKIRKAIWR